MDHNSPIAVFDSGVGSYSIVRVLQKELPKEQIIYLSDRANFPYGNKSHDKLKNIVEKTINWLEKVWHPKLIIIASNTPSIQVLDEISQNYKTKLVGIYPPIERAAEISKTKHIAILATKGAVLSSEIDDFIKSKNLPSNIIVHKVNASDLVALVEPGLFQTDKQKTKAVIKSVIDPILSEDPLIDVMTLSSTHLPFLYDYLVNIYPHIAFLDPADEVVLTIVKYLTDSELLSKDIGTIKVLTTVDKKGKLDPGELKSILNTLGFNTKIEVVKI